MSSLALMRFLESAPERYDAGMRILTLGRVSRLHDAVARAAAPTPGARVLEIGCGTGAVTERLVARGAVVTALDESPEMIEQGRRRLAEAPSGAVTWVERTASEIDAFPEGTFDAVVVSLALSEMSASERKFVLRHVAGMRDPLGGAHAWYVLAEIGLPQADSDLGARFESALAAAIERRDAADCVIAASDAQRDALWRLRETIPEAQRREGPGLKHDISVEPAKLPQFIEEGRVLLERLAPDARLVAYGHLGDGNLHFNVSAPAGDDGRALLAAGDSIRRAIHDRVAAHGGSISAEHGIGRAKTRWLTLNRSPEELAAFAALKRALDPSGILNPGVLVV